MTGDLNFDRVIDVSDFSLLYGYIQGNNGLSTDQLAVADINHDGVVDLMDVRRGMTRYGRRVHFEVPPFDPFDPARPVLDKVMPGFGPTRTLVTLIGSGFDPVAANNVVRLAGDVMTVLSASATALTFRVPSTARTGSITVEIGGLESCGVPFLVGDAPPTTNPNSATIGSEDVGLVLPSIAVAPGSRIEIPVEFDSGNHDLVGVDFRITFDPTVLHAVEMEPLPTVRFGQHFYRCIDNTTGVIAGAFGFGRTPGRAVQVANLVFDVVGTPGRIGTVGGRLNAMADMAQPTTLASGPRFLSSSQSFVLVSDGTFSESLRLLSEARVHATANALPDGRVLIAGGDSTNGQILSSATIFDPSTGVVTPHPTGMATSRTGHSATTLSDGRIVIAGGRSVNGPLSSIEIFEPSSNSFRTVSRQLSSARSDHAAVLMADGRIAWIGGRGASGVLASVEVFDPALETVTRLSLPMNVARSGPSVALLSTGNLIVTGGVGTDGQGVRLELTEIYDPIGLSTTYINESSGHRVGALHRATRLPSGTVVLSGEGEASRFDVSDGEYESLAVLRDSRTGHVAVPLPDGALFVSAGYGVGVPVLRTSEILGRTSATVTSQGPLLFTARAEATGVAFPDGRVVVVGGLDWNGNPIASVEVMRP
ncbi:MAG: IPT/TIG domain-containing protein [Planctomycetes bacterium]|nr:IPT/TIG domain-containing protein [Planctomycetota bacterium]